LNIPLITIGTLDLMAWAVRNEVEELNCPLIDARRMEVFTAIYRQNLSIVQEPTAMIIDAESFQKELSNHRILFSGNGNQKVKPILQHPNASFSDRKVTAEDMTMISADLFEKKVFADLAYTEPFYLKEFYEGSK
jgi:tRNA threonylcarbamoyladenosine biosynthesis protein TsaB